MNVILIAVSKIEKYGEFKMIHGNFKTPIVKYLYCLFFIVSGVIIASFSLAWGIDAIKQGKTAPAIFCFGFTVIGVLDGLCSIFAFQFNRSAKLEIDDQKIDAVFGNGKEIHEPVCNIRRAELIRGGKTIQLYFDDNVYWITYLENAKEICEFITSLVVNHPIMDVEKAKSNLQKSLVKFIVMAVVTMIVTVMMFVNIAWCVALTDNKSLGDFSDSQTTVFVCFAIAEVITVVLAMLLADRTGKLKKKYEVCRSTLLTSMAEHHKEDALHNYGGIVTVKYFSDYTYRIIVFAPDTEYYEYMLEMFDLKTCRWVASFDKPIGSKNLSRLFDDIEERFNDVMLID